jgi:hypothetical protein
MCYIGTIWDTKFRICEDKVFRFHKQSKKWNRCDDNASDNKSGYIRITLTNNQKKQRLFKLHRLVYKICNPSWNIMDISDDNQIDHIDNNKLNNKIENLRNVSNQKNQFNQLDTKGYYYNKETSKYQASIKLNKKQIYLGSFETEDEAHNEYIKYKNHYHRFDDSIPAILPQHIYNHKQMQSV